MSGAVQLFHPGLFLVMITAKQYVETTGAHDLLLEAFYVLDIDLEKI